MCSFFFFPPLSSHGDTLTQRKKRNEKNMTPNVYDPAFVFAGGEANQSMI